MRRIEQSAIDKLLLSDESINRVTGRLLATDCFAKFENWLDGEAPDSFEKVSDVLIATVTFGLFIITGVVQEYLPDSPEVRQLVKSLVESKLRKAFDE